MDQITCIVVDDEPLAVQLLEAYVRKTPFLSLKGSFTSGKAALEFLQKEHIDLIFSDIQMPGLSGLELSGSLPDGSRVIFTTAFSSYAVEGFKVNAIDYLLKPISYPDFLKSATKAKDYFELVRKASGNGTSQEAEGKAQEEVRSIFVKADYRLQQIQLDDIIYIEGLKDYVKIHLAGGKDPVLSLMRMKSLEEMLPSRRFARVHKSFIVQISKISSIEKGHLVVGKENIPIGETYQKALTEALSGTSLFLK